MAIFAALALCCLRATIQGPSTPVAQEREPYRIDFKKIFYATPAAEQADRDRLAKTLDRLSTLKGKVGASAQNLLLALSLSDQATALQRRLSMYEYLQYMLDTRHTETAGANERADASLQQKSGFLNVEIGRLDPKVLDRYVAAEPRLRPYRFTFAELRRNRPHTLSEGEESLLGRLSPLATRWQPELFEELRRDPAVAPNRDLHAFALIHLAEALNETARIHRFANAVDEYCFSLYLSPQDVDGILNGLAQQRDLQVEVQQAAKQHRDRMGGYVPPPPRFTLREAIADVEGAMTPLGLEYQKEMMALFDPANGRIDVAGGPARSGLGTGWGFPASQPSILYWPEFTGVYDDLDRGLAHEGGHAVHFQLMRNNHVLPRYSDGPGYFFESFAEFNQLLLADYLYRYAADVDRKVFFLSQFVDKAKYPLAIATYMGIEYAVHNGVANGTVHTAKDLDVIEQRMLTRFVSPTAELDPAAPIWRRYETFYTHPLYSVNHLLGAVLAVAYYQAYLKDPKTFVPRYLALMRNGFDGSPADLLKKFLGLDLHDPSLIANSTALLRSRIAELKALYAEQEKARHAG